MARSPALDKFCNAIVAALKSIRHANEVPSYLSSKAREINAAYIEGMVEEASQPAVVKEFLQVNRKLKICTDESLRTKEDIINEINQVKPFIDRIKSPGFKLMIDRYLAAHQLAIRLSELTDELLAQYGKQEIAADRK